MTSLPYEPDAVVTAEYTTGPFRFGERGFYVTYKLTVRTGVSLQMIDETTWHLKRAILALSKGQFDLEARSKTPRQWGEVVDYNQARCTIWVLGKVPVLFNGLEYEVELNKLHEATTAQDVVDLVSILMQSSIPRNQRQTSQPDAESATCLHCGKALDGDRLACDECAANLDVASDFCDVCGLPSNGSPCAECLEKVCANCGNELTHKDYPTDNGGWLCSECVEFIGKEKA